MSKNEEQADFAEVINEFDLSDADSSVGEDHGGGEDKTNSTQNRNNSANTKEATNMETVNIKNLKSKEERRQSTFESMDLSDDEEEDEDKNLGG